MKTRVILGVTLSFVAAGFILAGQPAAPGAGYHVTGKKVLGGEGGWDYLRVDPGHHHLFITRFTHVAVLDLPGLAPAGDIPGTDGVHGVAIAPEFNRGFTSNGRAASVTIFDLTTLKVLGVVPTTGKNPDAIIYDPASKRVFTFNGRSDSSTAIDAATGKVAGTVPLPGRPEFAAADGKGNVFVNLEDKSQVVRIDSNALTASAPWPLAPCESPSGMAIDRGNGRLFVGCHNKMMAVVATDTGRVVATVPIGQGVDANRFDPETRLAFSSNGDGTLTVVREESPDKFSVAENVPTQRGARTMALDPATHTVYLVTAEFGPPPAATAEHPHPRPTMKPGSFTVLTVSR